MKTAPYLDVISQNAQYQNEIPTHERTDNIVNFERGEIDLKIGNNNYTTDVVIGVKKNGSKIFYDLSNIKKQKQPPRSQSRTHGHPSNWGLLLTTMYHRILKLSTAKIK